MPEAGDPDPRPGRLAAVARGWCVAAAGRPPRPGHEVAAAGGAAARHRPQPSAALPVLPAGPERRGHGWRSQPATAPPRFPKQLFGLQKPTFRLQEVGVCLLLLFMYLV